MGVCVVAVADGGGGNEEGKGILLVGVEQATLGHFFDLAHSLFAVTAEVEVVFVAPKDRGACFDDSFGEEVVEVDNLIPALVADDDKQGALAGLDAVLHEGANARVDFLPHFATSSNCILQLSGCRNIKGRCN